MEKTNFNEQDNNIKMDNLDTPFNNNEPLVDMSKAMSIIKYNDMKNKQNQQKNSFCIFYSNIENNSFIQKVDNEPPPTAQLINFQKKDVEQENNNDSNQNVFDINQIYIPNNLNIKNQYNNTPNYYNIQNQSKENNIKTILPKYDEEDQKELVDLKQKNKSENSKLYNSSQKRNNSDLTDTLNKKKILNHQKQFNNKYPNF